jgi:hypothetical protein
MRELLDAIPDVDVLLALEPEELGTKLLFLARKYLAGAQPGQQQLLHRQQFASDHLFVDHTSTRRTYPHEMRDEKNCVC